MQCARALLQSANRGNTALQLGVSQLVPELIQFLAAAAETAENVQPDDPVIATTDEVVKILASFVASFDEESSEASFLTFHCVHPLTDPLSSFRTTSVHGPHSQPYHASDTGASQPDTQPGGTTPLGARWASSNRLQGCRQYSRPARARTSRDLYPTERGEQSGCYFQGTCSGQAADLSQVF